MSLLIISYREFLKYIEIFTFPFDLLVADEIDRVFEKNEGSIKIIS